MGAPLLSSRLENSSIGSSNTNFLSSSPSPLKLWRPAAQRNIKNKWSKLLLIKDCWISACSEGKSHATELVNTYLKRRYMPEMNQGDLKDMSRIREKACDKLAHKQELFCSKLVSSYKDMVVAVNNLVEASGSMRCYLKGSGSSPIMKYCDRQEDPCDSGDGGGIPVFLHLSISDLEDLAHELVSMFIRELNLKRFLVIGLLSIICLKDEGKDGVLGCWSDELYHGEFDDFRSNGMLIQEDNCHPTPPQIKDWQSPHPFNRIIINSPDHKTLEVYLVAWMSDLNIEEHRVNEIYSIFEEEMRS